MPRERTPLRILGAGVRLRCPACERGRIFEPYSNRMHDTCGVCGVAFERARGEFTGALMFFMGLAGFMALMGWFVLTFFLGAPAWFGTAWLLFFAVLFPILFYRNGKGLWVAGVHLGAGLTVPGGSERGPSRASGPEDADA